MGGDFGVQFCQASTAPHCCGRFDNTAGGTGPSRTGKRMEAQIMDAPRTQTRNAATVLVEKRDGRIVDFDPINIVEAVKSAFADLDKEVGPE